MIPSPTTASHTGLTLDVKVLVEGIDLDPAGLRHLEGHLRFVAAATLFAEGRLSMGKAARLCELNKLDFMSRLHEVGVPVINWTRQELDHEMARER
jgi:predicted HTH domain antitoxin